MAQRSPHQVVLTEQQRRELERRAAAYSGLYRDVVRAKAMLLAAEGLSNTEIAERLARSRQWQRDSAARKPAGDCFVAALLVGWMWLRRG